MKVIYAVPVELDARGGNVQHVLGICRHAAEAGVQLQLLCLQGGGSLPQENFPIMAFSSRGLSASQRVRYFSRQALEHIAQARPDWVYTRPFPLDYPLFTGKLFSMNMRYAYELNTLWKDELKSQGKFLKAQLYPFFERLSIRRAYALLPVTDEIAAYAGHYAGRNVPALVAGNGIDIPPRPAMSRSELRSKWKLPQDRKLAIMAGYSRPWHGYEKLLRALCELTSEWHVVLVGSESAEVSEQTLRQARELGVHERTHVLPWLSHSEVDELVWVSDVGISPLALEIKKMKEAQSLKVRHYLALGLPVLVAGGEAAVIRGQPFVRLLTDTSPTSIADGIRYLAGQQDAEHIRHFAEQNLSWRHISQQTFQFLRSLI